jgi:hypothetical protein
VRPDLASATLRRASLLLLRWHFVEHAEGATQREPMWLRELVSRLLCEVDGELAVAVVLWGREEEQEP